MTKIARVSIDNESIGVKPVQESIGKSKIDDVKLFSVARPERTVLKISSANRFSTFLNG